MGVYLVKKAFGLANYIDCQGRGEHGMTTQQATDKGNAAIDESIVIFDEVGSPVFFCIL